MKFGRQSLFVLPSLVLAACAAQQPMLPQPLDLPKKVGERAQQELEHVQRPATLITDIPKPPVPETTATGKPVTPAAPAAPEEANITLAFDQVPLPTFIQVVYGTTLKKNISLDPKVAERKDLVTLRTGAPQTPNQVAEIARLLLKSYGVAVLDIGGLLRIVPDDAKLGYLPEIRRGWALPDTPLPLRPVFQLVELRAVRNTDVAGWLRAMFGDKVSLQEDSNRNAVLLGGQSDNVIAAMEAIHVLDQPRMRGRHGARITPAFWSAEELAKRLAEILQAEGYSVATTVTAGSAAAVTLLPVPAINAVIAFAGTKELLDHISRWARELDRPLEKSTGRGLFTYRVQYTDAEALAKTLTQLLSGPAAVAPAPAAPGTAVAAKPVPPSRVVVNQATNTIIFQGSSEDFGQIRSLLQELDKPARAALIEVTVAEVKLTDATQLGVEWAFSAAGISGGTLIGGTVGGLAVGSGGLTVRQLNSAGDVRLLLNALASNDRSNILSSPRVLARNGETATIQVGEDVPIITAQQTTAVTGPEGGGTILQSVQYRNTGVILKVKPVIHAGDRIDLDIGQEVSSVSTTSTGNINSPTFSSRKLETKLTLRDGSTVLLGGLISNRQDRVESGIPLLKDIPGLGQLFRNNKDTIVKTELLVLITPYIISDDYDARALTEAFKKQLRGWTQPGAEAQPNQGQGAAPDAAPAAK